MNRIFSSFVDIRKGEGVFVALMFSYYYLVLITYYLLKPARDSLFLVRLGSDQLPFVFILIALIVVPVTTLYARSAQTFTLTKVINGTLAVLILNLLLLRGLIQFDYVWVYFVFYIWVSIFAILGTSQFWLLANVLFDPAQAKRLFWLLNLGGILGAVTGGEVTGVIVGGLGIATEDLLFVCMGLLACCLLIVDFIAIIKMRAGEIHQVRAAPTQQVPETLSHMLRTIAQSKQLKYMVGIISIAMMIATIVDFQFKAVSVEAFPQQEDLTSFLGKFYGRLSLISILIQSFLTYRVLRVLGVGGAIRFLPGGLLLGLVGMVIAPGLWMGVLLRGTEGSFRYSIDKTGRELLFLPIPFEIKKRLKIFIDMFLDRLFRGVGGVLLLIFTVVLDFSVREISLVALPLVGLWIFLTILVRKEYMNAFRAALQRREIDPSEIKVDIKDRATVDALVGALKSPNERILVYTLEMLESVEDSELVPAVQPLLNHSSSEVRRRAVRVLQAHGSLGPHIQDLLDDDDPQVRLGAVTHFLQSAKSHDSMQTKQFLEHPNFRVQAAAVQSIALYGSPEERLLINRPLIERLLRTKGVEAEVIRTQVADALVTLGDPNFRDWLLNLMDDPSPMVIRQLIQSSGKSRNQEFVWWLLTKLAETPYRSDARHALAEFKVHILDTLHDYLTDERVDLTIRMNIPMVISSISNQHSVDILTRCIGTVDPRLKYLVIKALNKLRVKFPELRFDKGKVEIHLFKETKSYYEILQILHLHQDLQDAEAPALLKKALEEKLAQTLDIIFRLLALRYPPRDMFNAYRGLVSGKKGLHANAIEFLDSVLRKELKRYLWPIIDQISPEVVIQKGQELFGYEIEEREQALARLIRGPDAWLRACAIYNISEIRSTELVNLARKASRDPDPVVRETADLILHRMKK